MNKLGIWIDSKVAHLIDPEKGRTSSIESSIEDYNPHGGARGKTPYASQDATKDTQLLGRKTKQIKKFCEDIMNSIDGAGQVVIFGPAQMKKELEKAMAASSKYKALIVDVKTADNMTENQLHEWVRNYFDN